MQYQTIRGYYPIKDYPLGFMINITNKKKRHETTIYLLEQLAARLFYVMKRKVAKRLSWFNVASITPAIPRLEMDAGRLAEREVKILVSSTFAIRVKSINVACASGSI